MNSLLSLLVSLMVPTAPVPAAGPAEIPNSACYAVAPGRASLPVRENYFTYSPIVAAVPAGKVFIGQRVTGENKVLVFVPAATDSIGIARFTFTQEVPRARCAGSRLFQPSYDALLAWTNPRPGEVAAPRPPGAERLSSWGCFQTSHAVDLGGSAIHLPARQRFFAVRGESDSGGYTSELTLIDAGDGTIGGTISEGRVKQVPLTVCGADAAFRASGAP